MDNLLTLIDVLKNAHISTIVDRIAPQQIIPSSNFSKIHSCYEADSNFTEFHVFEYFSINLHPDISSALRFFTNFSFTNGVQDPEHPPSLPPEVRYFIGVFYPIIFAGCPTTRDSRWSGNNDLVLW